MRSPRRLAVFLVTMIAIFGSFAACTDEEPDPPVQTPIETPQESPSPDASSDGPQKDGDKDKEGKDEKDQPKLVEVKGGATLSTLPDRAAEICAKGPPASRACPTLVPLVKGSNYVVDSFGKPGGRFQVVEMAAGAPSSKDFTRNAPPRVAHVVVEAGKPAFLIDLGDPAPAVPLSSVLGQQIDGSQTVTLERSWGWNTTLILAESFPGGGAHADHLVYRWQKGGTNYVISLHAWEPAGQAVRTLHRMVRSIKNR
jgi:hypothetical protein